MVQTKKKLGLLCLWRTVVWSKIYMTVNFKYSDRAYSIMLKFWVPRSVESILSMKPVKAGEPLVSGPLCNGEGTRQVRWSTSSGMLVSVPCDPRKQPESMQYHPRLKEGIHTWDGFAWRCIPRNISLFPEPSRRIGL